MEVFVLVAAWEEYLNIEVEKVLGVFSTLEEARAFRGSELLESIFQPLVVGADWRGFSIYKHVVDQPVPLRLLEPVEWTQA